MHPNIQRSIQQNSNTSNLIIFKPLETIYYIVHASISLSPKFLMYAVYFSPRDTRQDSIQIISYRLQIIMILKKFYKKRIERSNTNKWKTLIAEEINKASINRYHVSVLKGVKKYVEDNGGSMLLVNKPKFPTANFSSHEKRIHFKIFLNRIPKLLYDFRFINKKILTALTCSYTKSPITGPPNKLRKNYMVNKDFENKYSSVVNGYRQDIKQNARQHCSSIFVFGSSLVYSTSCQDAQTLPAFIDSQINNPNFQVINRGVSSADVMNSCFAILDTQITKGDIIILYGLNPLTEQEKNALKKECTFLDLTAIFKRPHSYNEVYYDTTHLRPEGNKAVAKYIAREINTNFIIRSPNKPAAFSDKDKEIFHKITQCRMRAALRYIDEEFPTFINVLKSKYKQGTNGIAVMNCNPFTLGHEYLVTTAANMVDNLYLFVIEEDKSYFKFKLRLAMVKEAVKHLTNVVVVPTGKYLVSSITFPEYFHKEETFNPAMDASYDLEIFTNYIAPVLKLSFRFIGKEPFCKTTRTHHETMKKLLPPKGISVIEIARLENNYGPISASKVRMLIKHKEFDNLESFLPKTTIDSLAKHKYLS